VTWWLLGLLAIAAPLAALVVVAIRRNRKEP
jgi:hypothetical protein